MSGVADWVFRAHFAEERGRRAVFTCATARRGRAEVRSRVCPEEGAEAEIVCGCGGATNTRRGDGKPWMSFGAPNGGSTALARHERRRNPGGKDEGEGRWVQILPSRNLEIHASSAIRRT